MVSIGFKRRVDNPNIATEAAQISRNLLIFKDQDVLSEDFFLQLEPLKALQNILHSMTLENALVVVCSTNFKKSIYDDVVHQYSIPFHMDMLHKQRYDEIADHLNTVFQLPKPAGYPRIPNSISPGIQHLLFSEPEMIHNGLGTRFWYKGSEMYLTYRIAVYGIARVGQIKNSDFEYIKRFIWCNCINTMFSEILVQSTTRTNAIVFIPTRTGFKFNINATSKQQLITLMDRTCSIIARKPNLDFNQIKMNINIMQKHIESSQTGSINSAYLFDHMISHYHVHGMTNILDGLKSLETVVDDCLVSRNNAKCDALIDSLNILPEVHLEMLMGGNITKEASLGFMTEFVNKSGFGLIEETEVAKVVPIKIEHPILAVMKNTRDNSVALITVQYGQASIEEEATLKVMTSIVNFIIRQWMQSIKKSVKEAGAILKVVAGVYSFQVYAEAWSVNITGLLNKLFSSLDYASRTLKSNDSLFPKWLNMVREKLERRPESFVEEIREIKEEIVTGNYAFTRKRRLLEALDSVSYENVILYFEKLKTSEGVVVTICKGRGGSTRERINRRFNLIFFEEKLNECKLLEFQKRQQMWNLQQS